MSPASWSISSSARPLLLAAALALVACGFRLQGSDQWPDAWQGYELEYPRRDVSMQRFVDTLDEALRRKGLSPEGAGRFTVRLKRLSDKKSVAAIGTDGKAVEFDLTRELSFQLASDDWLSPTYTLTAGRRLSFDPTEVLAKQAEEQRLLESLSRELAELLLLRAEADLRILVPES